MVVVNILKTGDIADEIHSLRIATHCLQIKPTKRPYLPPVQEPIVVGVGIEGVGSEFLFFRIGQTVIV